MGPRTVGAGALGPGFARGGYHIGAGLEPTYPDNEPDDLPLVYPTKQA